MFWAIWFSCVLCGGWFRSIFTGTVILRYGHFSCLSCKTTGSAKIQDKDIMKGSNIIMLQTKTPHQYVSYIFYICFYFWVNAVTILWPDAASCSVTLLVRLRSTQRWTLCPFTSLQLVTVTSALHIPAVRLLSLWAEDGQNYSSFEMQMTRRDSHLSRARWQKKANI